MLSELTASEFAEWRAFWFLEPWGPRIEDARAALLAAVTAKTGQPPSAFAYHPRWRTGKAGSVSASEAAAILTGGKTVH